MFTVVALLFGSAALIALALSAWVPPHVPLGRAFWALTMLVVMLPLAAIALFAVFTGEYAAEGLIWFLFTFLPIAAGWLLGATSALVVRFVRARAS